MKLHADINTSLNTVTAYGPGFIDINQVRYETAISFGPEGGIDVWPVTHAEDISTDLLRQACRLTKPKVDPMAFLDGSPAASKPDPNQPEVLLIGTGTRQHLLNPRILAPLLAQGIGIECMSSPAAARTYNVLMSEGRRVIAALLIEES